MTRSARSLFVFGVYLVVAGLGFLVAPNVLLGTLGIAPSVEPWPHVIGALTLVIAAYYIVSARANVSAFARASVWVRFGFLALACGLVVTKVAPWQLLVFGGVDAIAAIWTQLSLSADARMG